MAPSGDFGDKTSQAESFSLASVIPQHPFSNRRTWSHIETSTRRLVRKVGAAYVVISPAFIRDAGALRERIRIPDFVWKAIYMPDIGAGSTSRAMMRHRHTVWRASQNWLTFPAWMPSHHCSS